MNNSPDSSEYVIIPSGVASFLDEEPPVIMSFATSGMGSDEPDQPLPSELEVREIRTSRLSADELARRKERGEVGRTVYPLVMYYPQVMSISADALTRTTTKPLKRPVSKAMHPPVSTKPWTVRVVERGTLKPLSGVSVTAFMTTTRKGGIEGTTGANGEVVLPVPAGVVQELFVFPPHSQWSRLSSQVLPTSGVHVVELDVLVPATPSAIQLAHGKAVLAGRGAGVRVGVIDTGVGPHPDIACAGGIGPLSEPGGTLTDCSLHGTHVAGVIAARGQFPGLAPDSEVYSYRVFKAGQPGATNADVVHALFEAMRDGCHIINMSLGSTTGDPLIEKTVQKAMGQGVLIVAASGNDARKPLRSPASVPGVVSVSAMGCEQTYPRDSSHPVWECSPRGSAPTHYVANFSNTGKGLSCTAPGVGLVSTVPGGYLALDGTSMAAPVVTGIAACLLSANPLILAQKADRSRTKAIRTLLYTACNSLGFPSHLEGRNGLPS